MDVNADEALASRGNARGYNRSLSLEQAIPTVSKSSRRRLFRSTLVWVLFGFFGWYFPRYLIQNETTIATKKAPYQQTKAGDVIFDFTLNEPLIDPPTIPSALLTYTSIYLPFVLAMAHASISSRNSTRQIYETSTVVSAFSMTIGLSEMTTQLLKLLIQRRRPNFYQLCQFDPQTKACIASLENLREANFSFPSGHSSLAMCGMTFLVWYGLGKLSNSTIGNKTAGCTRLKSLAIMVIPWGWAVFVGASRLIDKWHHYSDVVAGLLLGFSACTITYHTWYPPVWVSSAGIPRVLLEEFQPFENHLKLPTFSE